MKLFKVSRCLQSASNIFFFLLTTLNSNTKSRNNEEQSTFTHFSLKVKLVFWEMIFFIAIIGKWEKILWMNEYMMKNDDEDDDRELIIKKNWNPPKIYPTSASIPPSQFFFFFSYFKHLNGLKICRRRI